MEIKGNALFPRPLYSDGINSALHFTVGVTAAVISPWILFIFIIYEFVESFLIESSTRWDKNGLVDISEALIPYALISAAKVKV